MTPCRRLYPACPIIAASLAVFREGRVLLARRKGPPAAALFSLPGGVVEVGETLEQAALRELIEETGVVARIVGFNRHAESIERDIEGRVKRHFVIASFAAVWISGAGVTGPEVSEILWADPARLAGLPLTDNLRHILSRARHIVGAHGDRR